MYIYIYTYIYIYIYVYIRSHKCPLSWYCELIVFFGDQDGRPEEIGRRVHHRLRSREAIPKSAYESAHSLQERSSPGNNLFQQISRVKL